MLLGKHTLVYQYLVQKHASNSEEAFINEKRHSIDQSL